MEKWFGRVALVTGASGGCGAVIARSLAEKGMKVIACARNIAPIQAIASEVSGSGQIEAMTCDLSKEDDILRMFSETEKKYGGIDVCINNAGLSHVASLVNGETEKWRNMLDVNVLAPSICARETIRSLRERGKDDGHIIHINSVSGHLVMPADAHFYSASKHALTALTEGLRIELASSESDIRVSQVSPGLIETEFAKRMRGLEKGEKLYASNQCLQPADVSDAVIYVLSAPPHVKVHDVILRPTRITKGN